ncbi:MAG: M20 family metallopeptidase [Desulfonatronovibrio sp.]
MNTPEAYMNDVPALINSMQEEMFAFLEKLVLIQSGTYNKAGVDFVAQTICDAIIEMPLQVEIIPMKECGNMVIVRTERAFSRKSILLAGHMDTVFPESTNFNFYREDESRAYGPGVMDMKGGLVTGIFALKVLNSMGLLKDMPVTMLFNSEEEIGSPYSRKLIEKYAAASKAAFVLEGGGIESQVVVGRKGKIGFDLLVSGKAGHAGCAGIDKPSAVLEAAHKVIALERLNSPPDILVNVGQIQGGMGPNSVAEKACLSVDVRFVRLEDESILSDKIKAIVQNNTIPGTSSAINIKSSRPPMNTDERIEQIYQLAARSAEKIGLPIGREIRGGVSDANFIAAMGVPVLDGLGPCGDMDHSDQEYIIKKTMLERTALLVQCMVDMHRQCAE